MLVQHNITEDRFSNILVMPGHSEMYGVFRRKEGEGEIITRSWYPPSTMQTDRMELEAVYEYEVDGVKHKRKYKFLIVEEKGKTGFFQDEFCTISLVGGKILKPKVMDSSSDQSIQKKVEKQGYADAASFYEVWLDCYKNEPDCPKDKNGYPLQDDFGNEVFARLQADMDDSENSQENEWMSLIGYEAFNRSYCRGIQKFMDKHFPSSEEGEK